MIRTSHAIDRKYGFRRDHPLLPRTMYGAVINPDVSVPLPDEVDISGEMPPIYDQGQLGSCTANAAAACVEYLNPGVMPSRLFIYYNERKVNGDIAQDNGSSLSTAAYVLKQNGYCPETEWPYYPANFAVEPFQKCYDEASKELVIQELSIQTLFEMQHCLANKKPFMMGFTVYESFESPEMAASPILKMPQPGERCVGGHAVTAVGYNKHTNMMKIRNSWGPDWGDKGHFYMPFDFIMTPAYASDFWCLQKLEA